MLETSNSSYLEKRSGKRHALLESHLMTESNWIRFKREFEKELLEFNQYNQVAIPLFLEDVFLNKKALHY